MKKLRDDCFLHDKDRLTHDEALAILCESISTIATPETIPLEEAVERFLAEPISAPRDIPFTDNAAVDGYAFSFDDHEPTGGFFPITSRIPAGETDDIELPGFSAARIFTGAPMPVGADTVAMQEDCERHTQDGTDFVIVPAGLKRGANCRLAGEDVKTGDPVASVGAYLRPQDLAAIASTGSAEISVWSKLKIGLMSSGDEVLRPGVPYQRGKVYDANHVMLKSLLESLPVDVSDMGVIADEAETVKNQLQTASEAFDIILSSGGASRGEEDHFITSLEDLGKCHLWQLAVKPGRPIGFGQINDTPCFVLPGNPVAAFVCFLMYVRPTIIALCGGSWQAPARFPLPAGFDITSKPDRREFLRGFIELKDGKPTVQKFNRDGSGLISGLQAADGLIEVEEATTRIENGDTVAFIPFSNFGIQY